MKSSCLFFRSIKSYFRPSSFPSSVYLSFLMLPIASAWFYCISQLVRVNLSNKSARILLKVCWLLSSKVLNLLNVRSSTESNLWSIFNSLILLTILAHLSFTSSILLICALSVMARRRASKSWGVTMLYLRSSIRTKSLSWMPAISSLVEKSRSYSYILALTSYIAVNCCLNYIISSYCSIICFLIATSLSSAFLLAIRTPYSLYFTVSL